MLENIAELEMGRGQMPKAVVKCINEYKKIHVLLILKKFNEIIGEKLGAA
jgi:hypothetical protein